MSEGKSSKLATTVRVKRLALLQNLEQLNTELSKDTVDQFVASARLERTTTLIHNFEELRDQLSEKEPENIELQGWVEMQDLFYRMAGNVKRLVAQEKERENRVENQTVPNIEPMGHSTFVERQRLLKLPIAKLPKFNGDYSNWLTFKNSFKSMIDNRTDIDDVTKFHYLKDTLEGPALSKISIFDISAENYKNAWKTLTETYDKKRVLISKHVDALLDTKLIETATSENLIKLIDDTRQHLHTLKSLDVALEPRYTIRILERALPDDIRKKWEESVDLDRLPTLEEFYEFIARTAHTLATFEKDVENKKTTATKRRGQSEMFINKTRKYESGARVLVATTESSCIKCRGNHPLYKCQEFEKLAVQGRWDLIKRNNVCRNCLRSHTGECGPNRCKTCGRFHHTLLHSTVRKDTKYATTNSNNTATNSKSVAPKAENPKAPS